ncbi:MAG: prepilin peptidase [Anaerolineales bacterium]|nr:prepilin peptidase [Anaerolineales bacterium]
MDILLLLLPVLTGWVIGFIVNYLADVLPVTRKFSAPACPNCNSAYATTDYLLFHACQTCRQRRPTRTWFVFILMIGISMYIWTTPLKSGFILGSILLTYFAVVFVIDLEHRLILHVTSIFGALLTLGLGWLSRGLVLTLIGGLAGFGIMYALYYLGVLFSKFRARKMQEAGQEADDEEALGSGDVILGGILGLLLGWPLIWFGLLLGIFAAGLFGMVLIIIMLARRKYKEQAMMMFMPYGPFLIASAFVIIFAPQLVRAIVPK